MYVYILYIYIYMYIAKKLAAKIAAPEKGELL
jgi:hypothetical protein